MPFRFVEQTIPELVIIEPQVFGDERGFFLESYKQSDFAQHGIAEAFTQDNHSFSVKNVLRGLHYQFHPKSQGKLVRVIDGSIWDVAVDIRKGSQTFLQWIGVELNGLNQRMLYIPSGFAHGFLTLSDTAHVCYKCTQEYSPVHDAGIRWDDPDIGIPWALDRPLLSKKDAVLPYVSEAKLL